MKEVNKVFFSDPFSSDSGGIVLFSKGTQANKNFKVAIQKAVNRLHKKHKISRETIDIDKVRDIIQLLAIDKALKLTQQLDRINPDRNNTALVIQTRQQVARAIDIALVEFKKTHVDIKAKKTASEEIYKLLQQEKNKK